MEDEKKEKASEVPEMRGMAALRERMKKRYPEKTWDDDDAMADDIGADYDNLDNRIKGMEEDRRQVYDMMEMHPASAKILGAMARGEDLASVLVREFGLEIRDAVDDPEMQEKIASAASDYAKRLAENDRLEKEFNKNLEESLSRMEKEGMSDEDIDRCTGFILNMAASAWKGTFSPEMIELARKALDYDSDMEAGAAEAEIRGRNAKITEKLRKSREDDGIPHLGGANNGGTGRKRAQTIFDVAQEAR